MTDTSQLLAAAIAEQQAGRLAEADRLYQQVLAVDAAHAVAWHLRGVLAWQAGQAAAGIAWIARAIKLEPGYVDAHNNVGLILENEGRLDEAVACFRRAIDLNPNYAAGYGNLGNVLGAQGKSQEAVSAYRTAIALEPMSATAHYNLAIAVQTLGMVSEAIESYRRAIELDPGHVDACNNLAVLLMGQSRLDEGADVLRQAIAQRPQNAEAYNNLGTLLMKQGKLDEAQEVLSRAIDVRPSFAEAHATMGNLNKAEGRLADAASCYRRAIEFKPELVDAYCNLGNVLGQLGRLEQAAAVYREALQRAPNHIEAQFGLGYIRVAQGKDADAAECFRRVIELKPDDAEAYCSLAAALCGLGNWAETVECCRRAIELRPDLTGAYINLAISLSQFGSYDVAAACCAEAIRLDSNSVAALSAQGNILRSLGRADEAIEAYRRVIAIEPKAYAAQSGLLYTLYFSPRYDAEAIYAEHRRWDEQIAQSLGKFIEPHRNDRNPDRRLRIGYFSPEFRDHCQSFFTRPLFSNHNHDGFEIFCYSAVSRPDHITDLLRPLVDQWRDIVGLSGEQIAEQIRRDQIDILVDLTLHMDKSGLLLFARRPAPIQVCWLAYPGTSGLSAMDYRLTDPYLDPPGMFDRFYSEESIRLPHTFWCYDPILKNPQVNRLPAWNNRYVTFGCLNSFCKINDGILRLWAKVMNAVERSRLILMAPEGSARARVLDVLANEGIGADRISFVPFQARADYLATYHKIDICLETLPYNGHTTSLDSFWMGVPVPTLAGQTVVGRAGVCLLENLGLSDLIAKSPDEYVEIVSRLAGDLSRLSELRLTLRSRMEQSPLMDGRQFGRDIEAAYRQLWRRWCEKGASAA